MERANSSSRKAHTIRGASSWARQPSKDDTFSTMAASTKERLRTMKPMGRGLTLTPSRIMNILAAGREINLMEGDDRNLETGRIMRASFNTAQKKVMVTMSANLEYMKANFLMGISVERGPLATQTEGLIKANGRRDC